MCFKVSDNISIASALLVHKPAGVNTLSTCVISSVTLYVRALLHAPKDFPMFPNSKKWVLKGSLYAGLAVRSPNFFSNRSSDLAEILNINVVRQSAQCIFGLCRQVQV